MVPAFGGHRQCFPGGTPFAGLCKTPECHEFVGGRPARRRSEWQAQPASQVKNSSPDCRRNSKSHDRERSYNRAKQLLDERYIDLMESNNEHNWLSLTLQNAQQLNARLETC
jgi:hypothetical protein